MAGTTSTTRRPRRCGPRRATPWWPCSTARGFEGLVPADPSRIHAEGHGRPRRARAGSRAGRRPASVPAPARSSSRAAPPRRSPRPPGGRWSPGIRAPAHVVVTAVEHSAVREASAAFTGATGGSTTVVGVDGIGRIDPAAIDSAIGADTALVHVQWGNHEVGTVQPVAEIVELCHDRGVLVHVDAAQAAGHVPIAFDELGADLLSMSGHKLGRTTGNRRAARATGPPPDPAAGRRRPGTGPSGRPRERARAGRSRRRVRRPRRRRPIVARSRGRRPPHRSRARRGGRPRRRARLRRSGRALSPT